MVTTDPELAEFLEFTAFALGQRVQEFGGPGSGIKGHTTLRMKVGEAVDRLKTMGADAVKAKADKVMRIVDAARTGGVTGAAREVASQVKEKYVQQFNRDEQRYGRAGAIAVSGAHAALVIGGKAGVIPTVPIIGGAIARGVVVGVAEGVRAAVLGIGRVTGHAEPAFDLDALTRAVRDRQTAIGDPADWTDEEIHAALTEFLKDDPSPLPISQPADKQTEGSDVAGKDSAKVEDLLRASISQGSALLAKLCAPAFKRLAERGAAAMHAKDLFTPDEKHALAKQFAAVNGTAELLGRSKIRIRLQEAEDHVAKHGEDGVRRFSDEPTNFSRFDDSKGPIGPFPPAKALEYFRGLVPTLGVDPQRFGPQQERAGFTLAVATDGVLLGKVQALIADRLATGQGIKTAPKDIQALLDDAGVGRTQKGYSENVWRTNAMDAYNTGADKERMAPDVAPSFPVWRYLGIEDGRERDTHRPHFGQYYPNDVSFAEVRDSLKGEYDGFQCRCLSQPIWRGEWKRLQQGGAEVSEFSEERIPVPDHRQDNNYQCGVAALQSVLEHFGIQVSEDALAEEMATTPEQGTPPLAIVQAVDRRGLSWYVMHDASIDDLRIAIDAGELVITPVQMYGEPAEEASLESGHYIVANGYDDDSIKFQDPSAGQKSLPKAEFLRRWVDKEADGTVYWRFGIFIGKGE